MKKAIPIVVIILLAIGGGIFWWQSSKSDDTANVNSDSEVATTTDTSDSTDTATSNGTDCGLTKNVTEDPYYVSGTAKLADNKSLDHTNLDGTPIEISGYVYGGADGTTPIPDAKIELWQADNSGKYHPNSNGTASQYDDLGLRGYITTDKNGYYDFTSIYPGYYEGRARHIHVKVSADGYSEVTTQLIFKPKSGDGVTYSTDSIAQSLGSCYLMDLDDAASPQTGMFTFRLEKS